MAVSKVASSPVQLVLVSHFELDLSVLHHSQAMHANSRGCRMAMYIASEPLEMEGGKERGREGGIGRDRREGGREGGREERKEGGREG